MRKYLGKGLNFIPDMTFLVNYMDEPAVLPLDPVGDMESEEKFTWERISHAPLWPKVKEMCDKLGERAQKENLEGELHFMENSEYLQLRSQSHLYPNSCFSKNHID